MKKKTTENGRLLYIDFLKFIGLTCIILAHMSIPERLMMLRNFDVQLMVIISAMLGILSYSRYVDNKFSVGKYFIDRIKRLVIPTWIFLTIYFLFLLLEGKIYDFEYYFHSFVLTRYGVGYVWVILVYLYCALMIPLFRKIKISTWVYVGLVYILYEIMYYYKVGINNRFFDTTFYYIIPYGLLTFLGVSYKILSNKKKMAIIIISGVTFFSLLMYLWYQNGAIQNVQIAKYPPRIYYLSYGVFVSFLSLGLCKAFPLKIFSNKVLQFISRHSMWIYLWHILMLEVYSVLRLPEIWYIKFAIIYLVSITMTFVINKLLDIIDRNKKIHFFEYLRS